MSEEEFVDQHDFNQFIREIAVCEVSVPRDIDDVVYMIPTPADDLYCTVSPGFGLGGDHLTDMSGSIMLRNKRTGEIAHEHQVGANPHNWKKVYESAIRDVMANWREYVL